MSTILYGKDKSKEYELEKEIKSGGEGVVYTIKGKPNLVAKIYKSERISDASLRDATKSKILAMLEMNFDPRINGRLIVAWPMDALFDDSGFFLGFVMPRIEHMKSLIWATRPSDRSSLWPKGYRWHYSIAIAFNLSLVIERLHEAGIIVGDMNTNNILIDASGNVTLIDADSFNISTKDNKVYKCVVGFPEVLPAELQGKDLTKPANQFNEKTDCFSLAVHIFNLLCNNCHPFGCLNYNTEHGSTSNPKIMDNIVKGYCPYVSETSENTVDDALDMAVFPAEIRNLFIRAFRYDATTAVKQTTIANRPSAKEWRTALGSLYSSGVNTCSVNSLHEFPKSYTKGCPWCDIEQCKNNPPPPPPPKKVKHLSVPVIHCDKDGHTLRFSSLDIEYGKSASAYAEKIPGYHISSSRSRIEVTVNQVGIASENPIRFTYEKDKVKSSGWKKFFATIFILGLMYCLIMYGLIRTAVNDQNYEQAIQYMDLFPFYKDLFSDDYENTTREIRIIENRRNEQIRLENYNQAVRYYRNGDYYSAYDLFSTIDDSYQQAMLYKSFCEAHMYYVGDYFSTIYNNISFEDAKNLLSWNDDMFCRYMLGTWSTSTSYGSQTITMTDNGGGSYTVNGMPELPGGGTFSISNGIWEYQYADTNDWVNYFSISITSKSRFTLYSYQTGTTYTVNKK